MDDVQELLAEYGRWRRDETFEERTEQLGEIVAALLLRLLPRADVQPVARGSSGLSGIAFDFEGRTYLVSFALNDRDVGYAVMFHRRAARQPSNVRWAVLCCADGPAPVGGPAIDALAEFGVLLDLTHLEAALAGLCPLPELIRDAFRRRQTYVPLTDLMVSDEPDAELWAMTPTARLTSALRVEMQTWSGVAAEVLLAGQAQQDRPTGLAWLSDQTALLTCPDGLVQVDTTRGHAHPYLALPGCHGDALVDADGAVLVMCGSTVVRWHEGQLSAVAGGFEVGSVLLPGQEGEPWVLSGSGVTFGTGQGGTLALTRTGERAGDQMRYPITFEAAVRSAVWLDRRRFFLAASGHSTVVDLSRTTDAGSRDEWITTPVHFPAHVLRAGADSVLIASPDGTGSRVALHRTDLTSRASEPVAEVRLGELFGLAQEHGGGPVYLLASLPDNDPTHARPVLMRVTEHRAHVPQAAADPDRTVPAAQGYDLVSQSARGDRRDYRLDRLPFAEEGQAQVFRAEHKASGTVVAFKRRIGRGERDARRMSREVEAARRFGLNPHVMPVLDFSPAHDWFVMPLAEATVEDKRNELQDMEQLRALVDAVAAGLAEAHRGGWIHRDIKPSNILLLTGRWVVADWGIVRRPRGQTSTAGLLTRAAIGTEGFAAPELSIDGHGVTPASDIYSLGQLIGWILVGTWPQANVPLLPPPGPWRGVVRQATQLDPAHRPQDMAAFLALVEAETSPHAELPIIRAQKLLTAANDYDDPVAAAKLLALAADQPDSFELYLDAVARLSIDAAQAALLANIGQSLAVVRAMTGHAVGDRGQWPISEAVRAIWWLLGVARLAAREEQWELLDAAAQGMCDWDGRWDRWDPRNSILDWMRSLRGDAATVVATALRAQPDGARYLHELAADRRVDMAIRSAVHAICNGRD